MNYCVFLFNDILTCELFLRESIEFDTLIHIKNNNEWAIVDFNTGRIYTPDNCTI